MSRYIALVAALVMLAAAPANAARCTASGAFVGHVSTAASSLVNSGSASLANAVAQAVQANPSLAADFVWLAQGSSDETKAAIAAGLAQAYSALTQTSPNGAARITSALACGDATTQALFSTTFGGNVGIGTAGYGLTGAYTPYSGGGGFGGGPTSPHN